ncbi:MAG: hypothetical protein ACOC2L_00685 [Candidatus Sumerlaeota bacterium]
MTEQQQTQALQVDYSIPGFQILTYGPSSDWALIVRAEKQQLVWRAFQKSEGQELDKLGSTIFYRGEHYHLLEEEETPSGWIYRLEPWPHGEIMNEIIDLAPAYVDEIKHQMLEFEKIRRRMQVGAFYEFLFGWLAARWQEAIADAVYISPADASRKNAILQAALSPLITLLSVFEMMSNENFDHMLIYVAAVSGFSFIEGCVRLAHVTASNQPIGVFILGAFDWVLRFLFRKQ